MRAAGRVLLAEGLTLLCYGLGYALEKLWHSFWAVWILPLGAQLLCLLGLFYLFRRKEAPLRRAEGLWILGISLAVLAGALTVGCIVANAASFWAIIYFVPTSLLALGGKALAWLLSKALPYGRKEFI